MQFSPIWNFYINLDRQNFDTAYRCLLKDGMPDSDSMTITEARDWFDKHVYPYAPGMVSKKKAEEFFYTLRYKEEEIKQNKYRLRVHICKSLNLPSIDQTYDSKEEADKALENILNEVIRLHCVRRNTIKDPTELLQCERENDELNADLIPFLNSDGNLQSTIPLEKACKIAIQLYYPSNILAWFKGPV
jgi:hypothetical protein